MTEFERTMLDNAINQVHSEADANGLAIAVIKLCDGMPNSDAVFEMSEKKLLATLINHEVKTAKHPCFGNIRKTLRNDLDAQLKEEAGWLEFVENSTENFRKSIVVDLEVRFAEFRLSSN